MKKLNLPSKPCESCGGIMEIKCRQDITRKKYCSRKCSGKEGCGKYMRGKFREKNQFWKGGRYKDDSGYVLIYTGNQKYSLEHRVAMEAYLGRKLKREESVHHINGIRDDNRIENLELWIKAHLSGIRVKDFIEIYSKEINKHAKII